MSVTMPRTGSAKPESSRAARSRVTFVGTGPGDPDLLTLAAVAALGAADLILLDFEGLRSVFEHPAVNARPDAVVEHFSVSGADNRAAQIAAFVEAGHHVVRLVEGDPFLDGRVAREAAGCVARGVDFEIVPGVSSLTAVPEYAGIALDDSRGVQFVSALDGGFCAELAERWLDAGTVVLSTKAGMVADFVGTMLDAGRPADDDVVVTFRGGSHRQLSRVTTLGQLASTVRAARVDPEEPVHVMLGAAVAASGNDLDWFETKPLFGWQVLVPKTKDNVLAMTQRLHGYGASFEEVPTLVVEPPRTPQQMDKAIRGLVEGRYEWIVFTSAPSVRAVREKFELYGLDARAFSGLRVASIDPETTDALQTWGIEPDLMPESDFTGSGLAAVFPAYDEALDPINRVFIPRAGIATETLVTVLTELGWECEDVTAYRTVRAAPPPAPTREAIKTGQFDAVVFTSSSTVRNLVGIAGKPHHATIVAAIGPLTAKTCEEHGLRVDVVATRPDMDELVDALAQFANDRRATLVDAGQPVTRPSQRLHGGRRRGATA